MIDSPPPHIAAPVLAPARANLDEFADTVLALARQNRDVLVVTSDSRGSGKLGPFGQALPAQHVEVGIAEQNLVGVAAGLAAAGKIVFAVSPACFLTARALEQIKNDVAYSDRPVKLVGISAGVSYGALGSTHHSLHDVAALRAIPNLIIVAPADNFETREAVRAAAAAPRPIYLRFGKKTMPDRLAPHAAFTLGQAITVAEGNAATIIATGETVWPALAASQLLAQEGIRCRVLSMHTLKPLDEEAVLLAARETGAMITVEEHSAYGGLGEACAAVLMQTGARVPFRIVAIPDEFAVAGSQAEVFEHYGLTARGLAATVRELRAQR
jgi:transketolase